MERNTMSATAQTLRPPSRTLIFLEGRAIPEFGAFLGALPLLSLAPSGDGHPVLVLPGLIASDVSTRPLRSFLENRGYAVTGWRQGRNLGLRQGVQQAMIDLVRELADTHQRKISMVGWRFGGRLSEAPPVPTTAIYSRSDGICAWQGCMEKSSAISESIEVESSHCGMGHHPAVVYAVADRLAQGEGRWKPFDRSGWRALLYPDPDR